MIIITCKYFTIHKSHYQHVGVFYNAVTSVIQCNDRWRVVCLHRLETPAGEEDGKRKRREIQLKSVLSLRKQIVDDCHAGKLIANNLCDDKHTPATPTSNSLLFLIYYLLDESLRIMASGKMDTI